MSKRDRAPSASGALGLSGTVPLSPRELEYLRLRGMGYTIACTAARMGVAESTAKSILQKVHTKLRVDNTIEALAVMGWLRVPGEKEA